MGRSTLKLVGGYEAWSRSVRSGQLTRPNGTEGPVLVRLDEAVDATPELLARLREDARLLGRLQHESVLRLEHVSAINGKIGHVYEGFECASAARVLRVLRARNQVLPARAAVEAAAAVALALDEALRIIDGDRAVAHPGPTPEDVLVDIGGRVKLAGFRVVHPGDAPAAPPRGYEAPEGGAGAAAATYAVGALLVELLSGEPPPEAAGEPERHEAAVRRSLIRALARPGDTPGEPVVQALRQALAHDPTIRGAPGLFGRKLRELAVALASPGLRAWAPGSIPSIQRYTPGDRAPSALPPLGEDRTRAPVAPPPLASSHTIAPLADNAGRKPLPEDPSRAFARGATIVPTGDLEDDGPSPGPERSAFVPGPAVSRPGRPGSPLPAPGTVPLATIAPTELGRTALADGPTRISGGPPEAPRTAGPPRPPGPSIAGRGPQAPERPPSAGGPPPFRPGPSAQPSGPSPVRAPAHPGAAPTGGPVPPPAPGKRPVIGPDLEMITASDEAEATIVASVRPGAPVLPEDPLGPVPTALPAPPPTPGPAISAAPGPSLGPSPAISPRASVLDDLPEPEPARRSLVVPLLVVGLLLGGALFLAIALAGWWFTRDTLEEEQLTPVAPAPVQAPVQDAPPLPAAEPPGALPTATPGAPAPDASAPAPAASPPGNTAAPASVPQTPPPAAVAPPAAPSSTPSVASPAPAPSAPSAPPLPAAEDTPADDDAPVRIAPRAPSTPSTPAPAPAAPPPEPAPAAAEPPAASSFKVSFEAGDPSITSLEVKCLEGAGAGASVTLEGVPRGNCRVTGRGADTPLITMVTIVADRSYVCFAGRTSSCK